MNSQSKPLFFLYLNIAVFILSSAGIIKRNNRKDEAIKDAVYCLPFDQRLNDLDIVNNGFREPQPRPGRIYKKACIQPDFF